MNTQEINVAAEAASDHINTRHVPQLSGNGREDGQKGKYRRVKSWDSEIVIDNQQKCGFREQSLKKRDDFAARRAKEHGDRAEQKRRDIEAAKPTIRYCLVMLDPPSDKRCRSYTTQKVMRGLV
jgi:hypothetical protein